MKNEQLYRKAIEFAAEREKDFLDAYGANCSFPFGEYRDRHYQRRVVPTSAAICAQEELIAHMFGVSEERVHEDIHALIESD